jgi:hypothetical protein
MDRHSNDTDIDTEASEEEKARIKRAERLRKQIEELKSHQRDKDTDSKRPDSTKEESPRDFIERKMHGR